MAVYDVSCQSEKGTPLSSEVKLKSPGRQNSAKKKKNLALSWVLAVSTQDYTRLHKITATTLTWVAAVWSEEKVLR